jgi:hypothetical protein
VPQLDVGVERPALGAELDLDRLDGGGPIRPGPEGSLRQEGRRCLRESTRAQGGAGAARRAALAVRLTPWTRMEGSSARLAREMSARLRVRELVVGELRPAW